MGLLSFIGRMFGRAQAPKAAAPNDWRAMNRAFNHIRAGYESSLSHDENARRWGHIDFLSARSANNYQTRRMSRMKSRYVYKNNCFAKGIVDKKVMHLIGTGPVPRFTTGMGPEVDARIKESWLEWADEVGFVEKLTTTAQAKIVSGEGVLLFKNRPNNFHSVKLYLQDIECDQVSALTPNSIEDTFLDGVEVDELGIPVSYSVLRAHPGDYMTPGVAPWDSDRISAKKMAFWFKKNRPAQVRALPELDPALELFEHMREYRLNTLTTAALQACYTVYLKNTAGTGVGGDILGGAEATPMDTTGIERGMATELAAGYEPIQLDPTQPGTSFETFVYMLMAEACRTLGMPLNLALGTSQKFNFSSARLDHLDYRDDLKVERRDCEKVCCNPVTREWLDEAVMIPGLLPNGVNPLQTKISWRWPGFSFMDPEKDAKADTERLANGTKTYQRWYDEQGLEWEEEFEQRGREMKVAELLGFDLPSPKVAPDPAEREREYADETE